jgi:hypothetical protein
MADRRPGKLGKGLAYQASPEVAAQSALDSQHLGPFVLFVSSAEYGPRVTSFLSVPGSVEPPSHTSAGDGLHIRRFQLHACFNWTGNSARRINALLAYGATLFVYVFFSDSGSGRALPPDLTAERNSRTR